MTEPQLLRKPLPPKEETELHISWRKGHKGAYDEAIKSKEKHKDDGLQLLVPAKSSPDHVTFPGIDLGSQALGYIMPSHLPLLHIKRDFIIAPQPSGPPSFPLPKHCTPLRMRFRTWKEYPCHLASEFALEGFAAVAPFYLPMMQHVPMMQHAPSKPILSRCNYEVITTQLIAAQTRDAQHVSIFVFPFGGVFRPMESRKPYRQMMIEKMLEEKVSFLAAQFADETREQMGPDEQKTKAKRFVISAEPKAKEKRDIAVRDSFVSGVPCKPQLTEEDEEKELMAKAEMAVLFCLLHKKTGLSLKAYFLPQLPGLSSLAGFLVYLNLSFNCLSVFPNEVFYLKHLEILKLRNNPIRFIPEDIKQLKSLKVLIMSFNLLTDLPSGLFELSNLEGLDLSYNELESISNAIGKLSRLTYLNLEGNQLFVLPCGILKIPLSQLKVENNFLHPYFWGEIPQLQIQRLTDMAALCFAQNNLWRAYGKLRRKIQMILDNYTTCSCCHGYMYGEGLRFMRVYRNAYGLRLPYLFEACSPACYTDFTSQTDPD